MSAPNVSPSLDQHVVNGGRGRHRRPLGGLWHAFKHKFKFFYMKFLICLLLVYPIREVRGYLRIRIRHHHYGRWSTRLGAAGFVVTHWNKIYFYSIVYLKKKTLSNSRGGVDSLTFNRSLLTRICCTFIFGHLPLQIILGIELSQLLMQTSVIKWCTSFTFNGNDLSVIMTNNTDQINRSSYLSDDVNQQM